MEKVFVVLIILVLFAFVVSSITWLVSSYSDFDISREELPIPPQHQHHNLPGSVSAQE